MQVAVFLEDRTKIFGLRPYGRHSSFGPDYGLRGGDALRDVGALWELPSDSRPPDDWVKLARLLSGHQIDTSGVFEPLTSNELIKSWQTLKSKYPEAFSVSGEEVKAWHEHEAEGFERARDRFAARFHLNRISLLERSLHVPPRDPAAQPNLIDLSSWYNAGLIGNWHGDEAQNDLASLPSGVRTFAGVDFDVRGLVQLRSRNVESQFFPAAVTQIRVGRRCREIHFLHSALWGFDPDGTQVGAYVLHYSDGRQTEVPIVLGRDLIDWWAQPPKETTNKLAVAWTGLNGKSRPQNKTIQLYMSTWKNPQPEIDIQSVDFISKLKESGPFLLGITAE